MAVRHDISRAPVIRDAFAHLGYPAHLLVIPGHKPARAGAVYVQQRAQVARMGLCRVHD
jgi:hypothetical protein